MITRRHPRHAASLLVLAAAFAPAHDTGAGEAATPSARAVARLFPLAEGGERLLLAVAEGLDDPLSAEAQAAEALGRLEAVVGRAAGDALPEDLLDAGAQAAAEGVRRLSALPGSAPGAGVALAAAIVEEGSISVLNAGHGAVFLQRGGSVRRLTGATSDGTILGSGGEPAPAVALAERLQPGDALLVASERVARGLGERVIAAVFEEYGAEGVADELANLAGGLPDATGAAVALLQLPGGGPGAAAGAATAPVDGEPVARPRWLVPLAVIGAIVLGVGVAVAVTVVALHGGGSGNKAAATAQATRAAVVQTVLPAPPASTGEATAAVSPTPSPMATATPVATATPAPSPTPGASATPSSLANLPACSGGAESKPCSYTAQPGDSLSVIGDRFDITRACFESANLNHDPVPPRPPDYRIGVGESYIIPDEATCATLPPPPAPPPAAATAPTTASAPTAATAPAATPAPRPALTPPPGAANPNRAPSAAAGVTATAAPAAAAPVSSAAVPARRGPCTPVPGEQFPRPTC
jgi:hypothetical protein